MRVLCLWLPNWPAQRVRAFALVDKTRPVIVHAPIRNLPRLVALTAAAEKHGAALGMPLAEAESLLAGNDPLVAALAAAADLEELKRLAVEAGRFGPASGIEETERPESLLIEVTGCAAFFGGERELARGALAFLAEQGYAARAGLADTVGLAWAASRAITGERITLVPANNGEAWLSRRPYAALRLDGVVHDRLDRLGLRTVGDVLRLPRSELPSRFGPLLLRRIDQALGRRDEPIEPVRPPAPVSVGWSTETPLTDASAVLLILERLIRRLLVRLPVWEGMTQLIGRFNEHPPLRVGTASPSRSEERLFSLVRLALDRQPPPREVSRIIVTAETVRLPNSERTSLFDDHRRVERERAFHQLIERLSNRLGAEAVSWPVLAGDPLPEHAFRLQPATGGDPRHSESSSTAISAVAMRPILLLPEPARIEVLAVHPDGPPHRLTLQGRTCVLVFAFGPERFEANWAIRAESRRDYWRVETEAAERLWIFRCRRSGEWFLHGRFG